MSTFFLYFNDGDQDHAVQPEIIGPQLTHFPWVQWKSFKNKNLQIIYTENKSDSLNIFPNLENEPILMLHGHILESENGVTRIDKGESRYSIENQLRKRYEKEGINSCIGLNGQYNFLAWNVKNSTLEIANDRLGICQLFFARINEHRFVITTDIVTLKSVPGYTPKISRRGIFDLLYMGAAFEERTVLEGVTRLLPNSSYQISKNGIKLLEEKRLPFSKRNWNTLLPPLLDELEQKYVQSIKRVFTYNDKILFFLSGGKDSRLYSHFLKMCAISPQCVTLGESHHAEVFLAHQVSRILRFPWQHVGLEDENSLGYLSEALKLDSFSLRVFPSIISTKILSKIIQDYDYVTATFLNDEIVGNNYVSTKIKLGNDIDQRANNYLDYWRPSFYSKDELQKLFIKDGNELIDEYKRDLIKLLQRSTEEPYHQLLNLWIRSNGRFKIGAALRELTTAAPLRLPCLDNDLMDFTFSMPLALHCDRLLMDFYLIQRSKNLAAIPLDQNSDRSVGLVRGFKQELKYRIWCNYIEKVKFPLLRFSKYSSPLTTQCYIHTFSLKERAFQGMLKNSFNSLSQLDGILDITEVEKLLNRPFPEGDDHIKPGNALRSLVTVTQIAKTFNS